MMKNYSVWVHLIFIACFSSFMAKVQANLMNSKRLWKGYTDLQTASIVIQQYVIDLFQEQARIRTETEKEFQSRMAELEAERKRYVAMSTRSQ